MTITDAQYNQHKGVNVSVNFTLDGKRMSAPMNLANRHYAEIMRQVEAGELTIQEAD